MHIYIYTHIYIYAYTYIHIYIYIYTHNSPKPNSLWKYVRAQTKKANQPAPRIPHAPLYESGTFRLEMSCAAATPYYYSHARDIFGDIQTTQGRGFPPFTRESRMHTACWRAAGVGIARQAGRRCVGRVRESRTSRYVFYCMVYHIYMGFLILECLSSK